MKVLLTETNLFLNSAGCYHMNDSGASYNGPAAHDAQGLPCELWSKNGFSDIEGNFCRNPQPSSHDRPFCFVEGRKSSCDIKLCGMFYYFYLCYVQ
ncbi:hypothetical protein DPMN_054584 [Dreissena polymorpha]|uniref:Kringle domain-containing protein n=1 Tax=Dreissena polymorpha TaxID=45954 RepID=A0A9D4CND8_DREPO|nr:hypothetical protein DPMN_054584 [Dreissena polymorpha]